MNYKNGDHYDGEWKEDLKHGRGIYFDKEINLYFEGKWKKGEKNGVMMVYKRSSEDINSFYQQYKNGVLLNEFILKSQYEILQKEHKNSLEIIVKLEKKNNK